MTNVIAYSNHSPDSLRAYINWKLTDWDSPQRLQTAFVLPRGTGRDADLVCPLLRSFSLLEAVWEAGTDNANQSPLADKQQSEFETVRAAAYAAGRCSQVLNAPPEELIFEPVEEGLSLPG